MKKEKKVCDIDQHRSYRMNIWFVLFTEYEMTALQIQIPKQDERTTLGKEIRRDNTGEDGLWAVLFNSKGSYMHIARKFFKPYKQNFKLYVILT
jgi:hypothetical protein